MAKSVTYVKTFGDVERVRVALLPAEHRQLEAEGWVAQSAKPKAEPKTDEPSPRARRASGADEPAEPKA
jgi:hypothetical protein